MRKRSVTIDGHRTSVSLEDAFWAELSAIAEQRGLSLNALVAEIDHGARRRGNLSSALRLFRARRASETNDQSSLKPLPRTNAPKSARSGTEYCRTLSSDQP